MNYTIYCILQNFLNILPANKKYIRWRGKLAEKVIKESQGNLKLSSRVNIYSPNKLSVGKNVYIGYSSYLGGGEIKLEDEVLIGPFCSIVAGNHTIENNSYRFGKYDFGSIKIGKGTWLGSHVVITNNVIIGKGSLIAAGSVVTKDIPDYVIAAGSPAKVIKSIDSNE